MNMSTRQAKRASACKGASSSPPTPSTRSLQDHGPAPPLYSPQSLHSHRWKKKIKIPSPSLTDCCLFSPLHFHSVKTSSRYLALRLKSIAVSPGRYRWQCCCAAAESSEHLEGWIQLQLIPSPAPGQAMDSASKPRSPTRNPNQVFAVSVYFVYPRPSLSGSSAVHRQLEFLFCGRDTVWESWERGGGDGGFRALAN